MINPADKKPGPMDPGREIPYDFPELRPKPLSRIPEPAAPTPEPPRASAGPAKSIPESAKVVMTLTLDDVEKLFKASEKGDRKAGQLFARFFETPDHPAWSKFGDMTLVAEKLIAGSLFPNQPVRVEAIVRDMQQRREALQEDDDSPLERLAKDRVIVAWAHVTCLDALAAASGGATIASPKISQAMATAEKRLNQALSSLQVAREIVRGKVAQPLRPFRGVA